MNSTGKRTILAVIRSLITNSSLIRKEVSGIRLFSTTPTRCSTLCLKKAEHVNEESIDNGSELSITPSGRLNHENEVECVAEVSEELSQLSPLEVLRNWGCNEEDISKLLTRRPALQRANVTQLEFKLNLLKPLGITSSDLVKIINCRPRFFSSRIHLVLDERINYLMKFLGSKEAVRKVIIRNPSLMLYDLHEKIKPVMQFYKEMGLNQQDIVSMLISRPTLIPRTNFNPEKFEYIHKTGVTKDSKMFKYITAIIGVSRMETIQEKIANFEKFGFSEEEVLQLFGKCPILLTISVEKIQRNMTYVLASMKLPAHSVLKTPFLLLQNLESHLRPRVDLLRRVMEMGLKPVTEDDNSMMTALRMSEKRFLKVYVLCHQEDVAAELMMIYKESKSVKRLAEESKKNIRKGFPF